MDRYVVLITIAKEWYEKGLISKEELKRINADLMSCYDVIIDLTL